MSNAAAEEAIYWTARRHFRAASAEGSKPMTPKAIVNEAMSEMVDGGDSASRRAVARFVKAATRARQDVG
jgi:hypothetical protein